MNTETLACHAWAENAAYCAEWRYWQRKAEALALDDSSTKLQDALGLWDRSIDSWGTLLELMVKHDPSSHQRAVRWGLENNWA